MILIFKTSVNNPGLIDTLRPRLNEILRFSRWNFDLHDCDNILRIDTPENISGLVTETFSNMGIYCEELH